MSLLLIVLLSASILWVEVGTLPINAQFSGSVTDNYSSGSNYVDLAYLASHFGELMNISVATIGTVIFSPSVYQFEDFALKGQGNTTVPVVVRSYGLPLPEDGLLVKVLGAVEFGSSEGGFFYLNVSSVTAEKNVILLGWDGVQRDHLFELLDRGLMPNLAAFVAGGSIVNVTVSDHYTDTQAGWTQILTGYRWWKTGVFSNYVWFHSIPEGFTIPERLENIYGKDQIATAFITGKLNHMEIVNGTGSAAVGSVFAVYSNEAIYSNLPSQLDVVNVGNLDQDRNADVVGPLTLQFMENNMNNHFFAFFQFSDPDETGHRYGENSVEYEAGIETCDYWLGQILAKLDALDIAKNTLIYITADHGYDEGAFVHHNAPYVFLATNDKDVLRNGDEVDVAATVYYGLGLWNYSLSPPLDGFPLQVSLPSSEEAHRQATLADSDNLLTPMANISDNGPDQKILTFGVSDDNLAAIFITLDNRLQAIGPWNWTESAGVTTADGSYAIDTTNLAAGSHNVKVLAFDEHAANNGGPENDPLHGGGTSMTSLDFVVSSSPPDVPEFPTSLAYLILFVLVSCSLLTLKKGRKI